MEIPAPVSLYLDHLDHLVLLVVVIQVPVMLADVRIDLVQLNDGVREMSRIALKAVTSLARSVVSDLDITAIVVLILNFIIANEVDGSREKSRRCTIVAPWEW